MMLPPDRARDRFGWSIFEWQETTPRAVTEYLSRDFKGIFEREHLVVGSLGYVYNRRFQTHHLHEFEALQAQAGGVLTAELIDKGYAEARAMIEARCDAFRRIMESPGPYLYVHCCQDFPSENAVRQWISLLKSRSPAHEFHLLLVGLADQDSDLSALEGLVSKAYRPAESGKPGDRAWAGNDDAWDKALAPFKLAFANGEMAQPA